MKFFAALFVFLAIGTARASLPTCHIEFEGVYDVKGYMGDMLVVQEDVRTTNFVASTLKTLANAGMCNLPDPSTLPVCSLVFKAPFDLYVMYGDKVYYIADNRVGTEAYNAAMSLRTLKDGFCK